jgi:hypothetical protein
LLNDMLSGRGLSGCADPGGGEVRLLSVCALVCRRP